jgi:hypothetical protein
MVAALVFATANAQQQLIALLLKNAKLAQAVLEMYAHILEMLLAATAA